MIFSRRKHPLPKFPPNVASTFKSLCRTVPDTEIPDLINQLETHYQQILVEISKKKLVSVDLVKSLYLRSKFLLEHYSEFKPVQQPLIIGAIYYFALDEDASPDTEFATGFDDDAQVMNHVLEELGVEGQFIDYQKLGESSR